MAPDCRTDNAHPRHVDRRAHQSALEDQFPCHVDDGGGSAAVARLALARPRGAALLARGWPGAAAAPAPHTGAGARGMGVRAGGDGRGVVGAWGISLISSSVAT